MCSDFYFTESNGSFILSNALCVRACACAALTQNCLWVCDLKVYHGAFCQQLIFGFFYLLLASLACTELVVPGIQ